MTTLVVVVLVVGLVAWIVTHKPDSASAHAAATLSSAGAVAASGALAR